MVKLYQNTLVTSYGEGYAAVPSAAFASLASQPPEGERRRRELASPCPLLRKFSPETERGRRKPLLPGRRTETRGSRSSLAGTPPRRPSTRGERRSLKPVGCVLCRIHRCYLLPGGKAGRFAVEESVANTTGAGLLPLLPSKPLVAYCLRREEDHGCFVGDGEMPSCLHASRYAAVPSAASPRCVAPPEGERRRRELASPCRCCVTFSPETERGRRKPLLPRRTETRGSRSSLAGTPPRRPSTRGERRSLNPWLPCLPHPSLLLVAGRESREIRRRGVRRQHHRSRLLPLLPSKPLVAYCCVERKITAALSETGKCPVAFMPHVLVA
nr:hypothetical protein Iba_chr11cCG10830 [Ipomoea batatas]